MLPKRTPFAPLPTLLLMMTIILIATVGTMLIAIIGASIGMLSCGIPLNQILHTIIGINHAHLLLSQGIDPLFHPRQVLRSIISDPAYLFLTQAISDLLVSLWILWRLPHVARQSWAQLGLHKPRASDLQAGFMGVLFAYPATILVEVIVHTMTHVQAKQDSIELLHNISPHGILIATLAACVIAPFTEELAFRAVLFNALDTYIPRALAVVTSGILFGLAHLQLIIAPELAAAGMIFALVYTRTRCLWSNMLTHALFNSIAFILIFIFHQSS